MSKKQKLIIAIALLSCIMLAFIGGQSYSKYVSQVKGQGTAEIATWDFKVNGQKEAIQKIDLGTTSNQREKLGDIIAPGCEGNFTISVDASEAEVGILTGKINVNDEKKKKDFSIRWVWPYETGENETEKDKNDKIDTQDAQNLSNYSFNIIVSGVQVNPNE